MLALAGALTMNAQNPFAYGLTGEFTAADNAASLKVNYALNTAADAVALQVLKDGEVVAEETGLGATKGTHTATIDLTTLLSGAEYYGNYTWQIAVKGGATSGDAKEFSTITWNHSRGVDTDRNFESPHFGNIYVTEGRATSSTTYYSCSSTGGGNGLYIFTPDMVGVKNNATDKYAFMGGLTVDQKVASGSTTNGADLARVRVAEDGRIFVTRLNDSGSYICVAESADDLLENNKFTSLLGEGSVNASDYGFYNTNNEFVAGPNYAFDIYGSGEDLKIATLSAMINLWSYGSGGSWAHEYELGNANVLPTPSEISVMHKHFTAAPQSTNICYDDRGGIWYSQYRDAHTNAVPSLVYVDANGEEKYRLGEGATARYGGGIRFSPDYKQLVMCTSLTSFTIYDVTYQEDGTPILTENKVISWTGKDKNINDFAWDLVGNLYTVSNGGEMFRGFAVPRADNTFATKAASKYAFVIDAATAIDAIEAENAPVEYYNLQGVKVENPSNGIFIKKQGAKATKVVL